MDPNRPAGRRFRPRWLPLALTLVLTALFLALGGWQLNRAEEKRTLREERHLAKTSPPLSVNEFSGRWSELRFRRVSVRGRYLSRRDLLLDNQVVRGQAGYFVITPFEVDGSEPLLLVNRGWVPVGGDRSVLPEVPEFSGGRVLSGVLDGFSNPGIRLAQEVAVEDGWPKVVLSIDREELAKLLERPVFPLLVKLDPHPEQSFERNWVWRDEFGPERHLGYAFQWYALAFTLVVIFVVLTIRASYGREAERESGQSASTKR